MSDTRRKLKEQQDAADAEARKIIMSLLQILSNPHSHLEYAPHADFDVRVKFLRKILNNKKQTYSERLEAFRLQLNSNEFTLSGLFKPLNEIANPESKTIELDTRYVDDDEDETNLHSRRNSSLFPDEENQPFIRRTEQPMQPNLLSPSNDLMQDIRQVLTAERDRLRTKYKKILESGPSSFNLSPDDSEEKTLKQQKQEQTEAAQRKIVKDRITALNDALADYHYSPNLTVLITTLTTLQDQMLSTGKWFGEKTRGKAAKDSFSPSSWHTFWFAVTSKNKIEGLINKAKKELKQKDPENTLLTKKKPQ